MATRSKARSRNASRSSSSRNTQEIDATRMQQAAQQGTQQQMTLAIDATSALLRGAEMWSQLQLRALQRTGQSWREAAEKMRGATNPLDILGVQNHLVTNAMMQGLLFAQDFMQAAVALQPTTAAPLQAEATNAVTDSMATIMQNPMMQAWQSVVNPMAMNGAAAGAAA